MNKLSAITTAAKKLYATGKYKKWTDAIKAASIAMQSKKALKSLSKQEKLSPAQQMVKARAEHNIKKFGATKIIQKGEKPNAKVTKVLQQVRTKAGTFKGYKRVSGITGVPSFQDPAAAREIELYADSDSKIYFAKKLPILKNLQRKYKKGNYNVQLAAKLWMYYIEYAMQQYNKEFGSRGDKWHELLSVPDRKLLALQYAQETKNEFDVGNFIVE